MSTLIQFITSPLHLFTRLINYIALWRGKVNYASFPIMYGRIILKNNGYCELGRNTTFRSSTSSNYVGLTKRCSLFIENGGKLIIEDHSGFSGVTIYCANSIHIGQHTNFGGNVCVWDTDFHPLDFEERRIHNEDHITTKPVFIGNDVFVGANSIILKGVTVGDRSVIGAGSVVTKNIPSDEVWAGNPARFIKKTGATQKMIAV